MFDTLRSMFAWHTVFTAGVYRYEENSVTGRRRASRRFQGGYSPIDIAWLGGADRG